VADGGGQVGPGQLAAGSGSRVGDLYGAGSGLGGADDGDEGVAVVATAADAGGEGSLGVEVAADPGGVEVVEELVRVVVLVGGDRQDADLDGGQPEREPALVALEECGDDAFHGSDGAAVDHDGSLPAAVGGGVGQVEAFGLVEVELDGGDGLLMAGLATDLQVEFRAVEGGFAGGLDERWRCRREDAGGGGA